MIQEIGNDPLQVGETLRLSLIEAIEPAQLLGPVNIAGVTTPLYRALVTFMADRSLVLPPSKGGRAIN
jgi:hypothetical protein